MNKSEDIFENFINIIKLNCLWLIYNNIIYI